MGSHKCMSMVMQHKKPNKLQWTQSWRKMNKKGKDEGQARKKTRKVARAVRAIVGMSVDDIKARRKLALPKAKPNAATEAALKEVKDRKKAKGGNANAAPRGGASVPKMQVKHK